MKRLHLSVMQIRRIFAFCVIVGTLSVAGISFVSSLKVLNTPFAGFFFGPNLLVSLAQRADWPGVAVGLKPLDRIIAVNGVDRLSHGELLEFVGSRSFGDVLTWHIERDDRDFQVLIPVTRHSINDFIIVCLVPFLIGLIFIAFGGVLFFSNPAMRGRSSYLLLCSVVSLFCVTIYEAHTGFWFYRLSTLSTLIGAFSAQLFLMFSDHPGFRSRLRPLVVMNWIFAGIVFLLRHWGLTNASVAQQFAYITSVYTLAVLFFNGFVLLSLFWQSHSQEIRDKIKVTALGLLLSTFFIAAWSFRFLLDAQFFYFDAGILGASILPIFMGYAVVRRNVFRLDRFIRLSLSYGISAALVLVFYFGTIGLIRSVIPDDSYGYRINVFMVGLAVGLAILFNLARLRINDILHRVLFHSKYRATELNERLHAVLSEPLAVTDIVRSVGGYLRQIFDAERIGVLLRSQHFVGSLEAQFFGWLSPPNLKGQWPLFESEGLLQCLQVYPHVIELDRSEVVYAGQFHQSTAFLRAHGVEMVVGILSGSTLYGLLLLGAKQSGDKYDEDDQRLLVPVLSRLGLIIQNSDLTQRAAAQARLAALGNMASVLIHDIKNPLSTIKISAGNIQRRFAATDVGYELAGFIQQEVDRMDQTIEEVLMFAKPSATLFKTIAIDKLVVDTTKAMQPLFGKKGVTLEIVNTMAVAMSGNEIRLRRALENLLANALDVSDKGATVDIEISMGHDAAGSGGWVDISVSDHGAGIPSEIREKIFEPFFSTKSGGTGLGLSLVRQVVSEHAGHVQAESVPGKGTRFTMRFLTLGADDQLAKLYPRA